MKIGITGTRSGMTELQRTCAMSLLQRLFVNNSQFHHGDCIGVDVQAAEIAAGIGFYTVCHPPIKTDLRGNHKSNEFREPLSYFARNRNIVDETDFLIVVPFQMSHQTSGGTWYTHDYAIKKNKPIEIIWPE